MSSTPFLGRFYFERSLADLPSVFCNTCHHIVSETGGRRDVCKTRPTSIYGYPMCYLPHTVITSDLGSPNGNYHLEFNRVLSENSAVAVFSVGQEAPIAGAWPRNQRSSGCWSRIFPTASPQCYATVSVGSYWPFKLSYQAIWYWNAEDGVLLVDWSRLYSDYFAQARSNKSKRRIERIVQRYRDLEAEKMRNDTEGQWSAYGDWDVFPATHAEIAMVCRSEGPRTNFEDRFDPKKNQMSAQELIMRLGDSIVAVGDALRRCVDGKSNLYAVDDREEECPKGPVSLWKKAGHTKIS